MVKGRAVAICWRTSCAISVVFHQLHHHTTLNTTETSMTSACMHALTKQHHALCMLTVHSPERSNRFRPWAYLDMTTKVKGFAHGGDVLIWSAEDVVKLDREWRMCSGLIGSLPGKPRQNSELGLPFKLSPEEATLLMEKDAMELLDYTPPAPTCQNVRGFLQSREQEFQQQFVGYLEKQAEYRLKHTEGSEGSKPKRAKLELEDYRQHSSFSPLVKIFTTDPRSLSTYQPCTNWTFPVSKQDEHRYLVFKDLWERGYTLTSGLKYGGDYLVYLGHPHLVHASFIAIVLPWKQAILSLGSVARVGSKVKKNVLVCGINDNGGIHYLTAEWIM